MMFATGRELLVTGLVAGSIKNVFPEWTMVPMDTDEDGVYLASVTFVSKDGQRFKITVKESDDGTE